MHLTHLALAGALAFAACEVGASVLGPDLPIDEIESCLDQLVALSAEREFPDSESFDLNTHCSRLAKQLARSSNSDDFLRIDATTIEGLRDLRFFAAGFDRQPASPEKFQPDFDGLDALLADVLVEKQIEDGLWERILRWLEERAGGGESPDFQRFVKWLEALDLPPWLGEVIFNGSLALIILLALMVVGNELRLAGVLRRMRARHGVNVAGGAKQQAVPKPGTPSLDELEALPHRQMAAGVLQIVTAAFAKRGWMSSSPSLTNGDRLRQLRQHHRAAAASFAELVDGIEQIIYGDMHSDDAVRQRLVAAAGELVEIDAGASTPVVSEPR